MEHDNAVRALAALAHDTRLAVYRLLVQQGPTGMSAGEIAVALDLAPATLSFHLKELAHAQLVSARQAGRFVFYAADFGAMAALVGFLTENCCAADGSACAPSAGAACSPQARSQSRSTRKGESNAAPVSARNSARKGVKP